MRPVTHIPLAVHRRQAKRVAAEYFRGRRQVGAPHFLPLHNQQQKRKSDTFRRFRRVLHVHVLGALSLVAEPLSPRRTVAVSMHHPVFLKYHGLNGCGGYAFRRGE